MLANVVSFTLGPYTVFLIVQSRRETQATRDEYAEALPAFSAAMLPFVAPLTIVTLLVSMLRVPRSGR